jgi:hypothetical protein
MLPSHDREHVVTCGVPNTTEDKYGTGLPQNPLCVKNFHLTIAPVLSMKGRHYAAQRGSGALFCSAYKAIHFAPVDSDSTLLNRVGSCNRSATTHSLY